jgi:hypothetical protein
MSLPHPGAPAGGSVPGGGLGSAVAERPVER